MFHSQLFLEIAMYYCSLSTLRGLDFTLFLFLLLQSVGSQGCQPPGAVITHYHHVRFRNNILKLYLFLFFTNKNVKHKKFTTTLLIHKIYI